MSEIIIIGAGAAGLMAARELSTKGNTIILLEARNFTGGRIWTIQNNSFMQPVEAGAEFIHGKLPLTIELLQEANIHYKAIEGKMVRIRDGEWKKQEEITVGWDELIERLQEPEQDMTVADFLKKYFNDKKYTGLRQSVQRFAEGFDVADITKASAFALRDEWMHEEDEHYRIPGGYQQLIHYLEKECRANGCKINTSCVVKKIYWEKDEVKIISADGRTFTGNKVIVTVPIGVLQADDSHAAAISFDPVINEYKRAALQIGWGSVTKILLQFKEAFWNKEEKNIGFLLSEEIIPTWWTQLPDRYPLLTGWLGGPQALSLKGKNDSSILHIAIGSLSGIFNKKTSELQQLLTASHIGAWHTNNFSLGAYSYSTLQTANARKLLNKPLVETLFFAGEALYDGYSPGTVEAALVSGKELAGRIASG